METLPLRSCSLEQARVTLPDVLHRVAYLGEHVEIYRCGERLGVIIPLDVYHDKISPSSPPANTIPITPGDSR